MRLQLYVVALEDTMEIGGRGIVHLQLMYFASIVDVTLLGTSVFQLLTICIAQIITSSRLKIAWNDTEADSRRHHTSLGSQQGIAGPGQSVYLVMKAQTVPK